MDIGANDRGCYSDVCVIIALWVDNLLIAAAREDDAIAFREQIKREQSVRHFGAVAAMDIDAFRKALEIHGTGRETPKQGFLTSDK